MVATHNPGKLRELEALLRPFGVACVTGRTLNRAGQKSARGRAARRVDIHHPGPRSLQNPI